MVRTPKSLLQSRYPFRNLVFQGGGVKAYVYHGVLKVLDEEEILSQIEQGDPTAAEAARLWAQIENGIGSCVLARGQAQHVLKDAHDGLVAGHVVSGRGHRGRAAAGHHRHAHQVRPAPSTPARCHCASDR